MSVKKDIYVFIQFKLKEHVYKRLWTESSNRFRKAGNRYPSLLKRFTNTGCDNFTYTTYTQQDTRRLDFLFYCVLLKYCKGPYEQVKYLFSVLII